MKDYNYIAQNYWESQLEIIKEKESGESGQTKKTKSRIRTNKDEYQ